MIHYLIEPVSCQENVQKCNRFSQYYYLNMHKEFQTILKRKSHRERFYSSMNYEQFCDVYGPPSPLFKPLEDPLEDIPLFDLEGPTALEPLKDQEGPQPFINQLKMDTILQIDGSQNFTLNMHQSPRVQQFSTNAKSRQTFCLGQQIEAPKRVRVRMRSQSDNSEYLIFNFLERVNQNGRKRQKID